MRHVPINKKIIDKYYEAFKSDEKYPAQIAAAKWLFNHLPNNKKLADVLLKVTVLNQFYSTRIFNVDRVAKHVVKFDLDKRLRSGDLSLVDDMKSIKLSATSEPRSLYSFASKYCTLHNPKAYVIYDSYIDRILWARRSDGYFSEKIVRSKLKDYEYFIDVLSAFCKFYNLGNDKRKIDLALWTYGKALGDKLPK
jgi:hypothetical protein